MRLLVRHASPLRRWHVRLGERLEAAGHDVAFEAASPSLHGRWLPALERRLYSVAADWDAVYSPPIAKPGEGAAPELTIVLTGATPATGRVIEFEIDGRRGEAALLAASRGGVAPLVRVLGGPIGATRLLAAGRPAIEDPFVSARALETLVPRLVTLLVQGVARLSRSEEAEPIVAPSSEPPPPPAAFFVRAILAKLRHRLGSARGRPAHWRLALRRVGETSWSKLRDDPQRFRADPFLFEDRGQHWLFYEDYPYGEEKGVIGCVPIGSGDSASADEGQCLTVLAEQFHLSYPLVLRHRDEIYMLPEAAQSGRLQLYRAISFPDGWIPDAVLLEGKFGDATPILHDGRWWLFATANDDGSSWDQLHLFHAPDLLGPWTPHVANPVLIDAGSARPAGLMWQEDGILMRPAQDCRTGYGAAVVVCRVDRLDDAGYAQTVVHRIDPPAGATGIHTLNRAGEWETADLKAPRPRR